VSSVLSGILTCSARSRAFESEFTRLTITKLKEENRDLVERVQQLEEKAKLEESYFHSYDLASLFVFYFVEPALSRHHGCTLWREFVAMLDEMEANLEGKITVAAFRQWLQPLEQDVGVDIMTLRQMMTERHTIAHADLRSAANQSKFLASLATYIPPPSFPFLALFLTIRSKFDSFTGWKKEVNMSVSITKLYFIPSRSFKSSACYRLRDVLTKVDTEPSCKVL
jgi:hypothetical protein